MELDVFGALTAGHSSAPAIAAHCGVPARGIRILCDYLAIAGLVDKAGDGTYRHTPTSAVFLCPNSPASMAPTLPFLLNKKILRGSDVLTDTIRAGRTALKEALAGDEVEEWTTFARTMHPMMGAAAEYMAAVGSEGGTAPEKVLDVAASHGLFGLAFARHSPGTQVVALDFPSVLDVTRQRVEAAGFQAQYRFLPGSAFRVDPGTGYDIVLVTNLYHHFDMPTCETLMRRFQAALKPGGRMLTLEMVPNEDRVTPPVAASFAMMMLANTPAGDAFTLSEYTEMLTRSGFHSVELRQVPQSPQQLVIGTK